MDVAKYETAAIVHELRASQERLGMSRFQVPRDLVPLQGVLLQHNLGSSGALLTSSDRVSSGSTQRQYDEMRRALAAWEENDPRFAPARERAFYGALRNLLMECLSETTDQGQSNRLKAAYRWYIKNIPMQRPDNLSAAAAAATSLSVPRAKTTSYSEQKPMTSTKKTYEIQQATAFEVWTRHPYRALRSLSSPFCVIAAPGPHLDEHPLLRPSLSPVPAGSPLPDLSASPEPNDPPPGTHRPLSHSVGSNPLAHSYQRSKSKNRSSMLYGSTGRLSMSMQKEMAGLSEEDIELHSLRTRWRLARNQENNWSRDVQETMTQWSVHRARVEEEMSRRQEAARYGAPYTTRYSTTFNVLVEARGFMTCTARAPALESANMPYSLAALRGGLLPPSDRSIEECMSALPRPGASLYGGELTARAKGKGSKSAKGRRGKSAPKKR
eukprot:jgi/Tetstr1/430824/TSEL_020607.t1